MFELNGKYTKAVVYTDNIEQEAISQIIEVCNQDFTKGCRIAIMPDVHAGKGCTIGTTIEIKDKVVPNLVGVDIGCGMLCVKLIDKEIDFQELDDTIRKFVPYGMRVRETPHKYIQKVNLEDLKCKKFINIDRASKSLGTLGGGNHFIEVNKDADGNIYLVIHTGSRYLGKQVAEYYQNIAIKSLTDLREDKQALISKLKKEGREKDIEAELKNIEKPKIATHLAYLEGQNLRDYLHDIDIVQKYSTENRNAIADTIISNMGLKVQESFTTIHNYIDLNYSILRKGAISAQLNEKVIIPINMRDGSIIAVGKGNPQWNYSAPHGAGRVMSRRKAKELLSLDDFKKTMSNVWTTSVSESTLDESPEVYKPINDIISNIYDTVEIKTIIKPIYNFKAD